MWLKIFQSDVPSCWPQWLARDSHVTKMRPIKALPKIFLLKPAKKSSICISHGKDDGWIGSTEKQYTSLCQDSSVREVNRETSIDKQVREGERKVLEPSISAISVISIMSQQIPLLCFSWFVLNFVSNNQKNPDKLFFLELTTRMNKKALFLSHKFLTSH
jgi:hypothetical protein